MTLLLPLFLTSRNLSFWCIFGEKNYNNLIKNNDTFQARQLKGVLLSVKVLEYFGKIL